MSVWSREEEERLTMGSDGVACAVIEQVQRTRAGGDDRGGGDGVVVGHHVGVQGGGRDGGELDGGDERGGAGRVLDGGELVRRGDGVELEGWERGDDGRREYEHDGWP